MLARKYGREGEGIWAGFFHTTMAEQMEKSKGIEIEQTLETLNGV